MEITRTARPLRTNPKVSVWHCRGCQVVHMSIGNQVLDLTGDEFARLTAAVAEANYQGLQAPISIDHSIVRLAEGSRGTAVRSGKLL